MSCRCFLFFLFFFFFDVSYFFSFFWCFLFLKTPVSRYRYLLSKYLKNQWLNPLKLLDLDFIIKKKNQAQVSPPTLSSFFFFLGPIIIYFRSCLKLWINLWFFFFPTFPPLYQTPSLNKSWPLSDTLLPFPPLLPRDRPMSAHPTSSWVLWAAPTTTLPHPYWNVT